MFRNLTISARHILRTCDIGDTVYLTTWQGIIIPCEVVGKDVVYEHNGTTIWAYLTKGSKPKILAPVMGEVFEWKEISELPSSNICNEFLVLDEPVGHSVQLGEQVFETLEEAREHVLPSRKKHLKRRLNHYRFKTARWVASTRCEGKKYGKVSRKDKKLLLDKYKQENPPFKPKKVYVK